jgi:tetratricopeptide (TPR) repeat protein
MPAERWSEVKQILSSALELDPADRPAFLITACSGDAGLMLEVQSLLDAYAKGGSFLERPAAAASGLVEGARLGNYRIEALIGAGGMGEVYRAVDVSLGLAVAIKVLPAALSADPARLFRLEQEARAAAALSHPNILYVHRLDRHEGLLYVVSELLEGRTLREEMQRGPLPIASVLDYAAQTANGLGAAHNKGIVHRDIKPENLFVTQYGQVKILDFGLVKGADSLRIVESGSNVRGLHLTEPGALLGTTAYMSPEQIRGHEATPQSDVFSLGIVLYEMATGVRPFQGETAAMVWEAILNHAPPAPQSLNPEVPLQLETVILRALEKDPAARYRDSGEAHQVLLEFTRDSGSGAAYVSSSHARTLRAWWAASTWKWALPLFLALAVLAAVVVRKLFPAKPALTQKDTIVLADFTNRTNEPVFDDTLKEGLAVDLRQSPFLNILSDEKIREQLRQMERPPDQRLTREVAQEVCLRAGSKAVLFSSISSLGSHYVITLKAVNCQSSDLLGEEQGEADQREKVLGQLHDLGERIRGKLGESLDSVRKNGTPLEQATTSSLEALQAYTAANRVFRTQGEVPAIPLFKKAIELDPGFAQAYADLSEVYANLNEYSSSMECARKAYALRDRVSEWERFAIDSTYYRSTGQLEKQAQVLNAWKQAYPRAVAPYVNLDLVDASLGRYDYALEDDLQGMELHVSTARLYGNLVDDYISLDRLDDASRVLEDARKRNIDESMLLDKYEMAFLRGDDAEMLRLVSQATGKSGVEDTLLASQSDTEAFHGRLIRAREFSRQAVASAIRGDAREAAAGWQADDALREAEFGNRDQARRSALAALALTSTKQVQIAAALALARAGEVAQAQRIAATLEKNFPEDTLLRSYWLPSIRAAIALSRKEPGRAIEYLQAAVPYELGGAPPPFSAGATLYPAYLRGMAYLAQRNWPQANAEFQKLVDHRGLVLNSPLAAMTWLQLGRAHAGAGARPQAAAAYGKFLDLWRGADPANSIARQARAEMDKLK